MWPALCSLSGEQGEVASLVVKAFTIRGKFVYYIIYLTLVH